MRLSSKALFNFNFTFNHVKTTNRFLIKKYALALVPETASSNTEMAF